MEQHIDVDPERATLLEVVLGSMFSSFEKLRRSPINVASEIGLGCCEVRAATRPCCGGRIAVALA